MKLSDYEFFPGVAIDVADPKYLGRIKATVPTIFDPSMDKEGLPWIRPFTMIGYQGFSKTREGSKIWVFRNMKNRNEFWYMPMFELNEDTRGLINDDEKYENGDVLISRNNGNNSVYIYYNDTDGMMIKYGEQNFINITPKSEIIVQANEAKIVMKDNHVYIGDGEKGEKAVFGETLKSLLGDFLGDLIKAQPSAFPVHGAAPYAAQVTAAASKAKGKLEQILCKNTSVD